MSTPELPSGALLGLVGGQQVCAEGADWRDPGSCPVAAEKRGTWQAGFGDVQRGSAWLCLQGSPLPDVSVKVPSGSHLAMGLWLLGGEQRCWAGPAPC